MYKIKKVRDIFVCCLFATIIQIPRTAIGQAPSYSREAVAARKNIVEEEGVVAKKENLESRVGSDMLMNGPRSIGSARSSVRGRGGQSAMLRYDQHREVSPPRGSTIRIGPWYTDIGIGQSIGAQYTRMEGTGVDYITRNGRGRYIKDGFEMPMRSQLSLNNYLMISRHVDLSFNINVSYEYYPFKTQEDTFDINMSDEGVFATFSSEFELGRNSRLLVYDDILYKTDYIDTRGFTDEYGGQEYEHFENTIGADWDWMLTRFDNISASGSRQDVISFNDEFADQDRVLYSEMVSYQRELNRFALAGVMGSFSQSFYDIDTRPDLYMYSFSAFTSAQLTRRLFGSASLGYTFSEYDGENYSGRGNGSLSGSLGLGHQISKDKSQRFTYNRTQREAFRGGVDVTDALSYEYRWESRSLPGSFTSQYTMFTPTGDSRGSYSNWQNSLRLQHQLTRKLQLLFNTSYDIRSNDATDAEIASDIPDIKGDYATWTIRIGTGMPLTRKTRLSVYAQHADRMSDNEELEYTQDTIAAIASWSHNF